MASPQQQPAAALGRRRVVVGRACSAAFLAAAVLCGPSIHPATGSPVAIERTAGWTIPTAPSQDDNSQDDDFPDGDTQAPNPLVLDSTEPGASQPARRTDTHGARAVTVEPART